MKEIFNGKLEIKVITYQSEEDMNIHINKMINEGWECSRQGLYMMKPSSLISDFDNNDNWEWSAEFIKRDENIMIDKPTSYESQVYWFNIYEKEDAFNKMIKIGKQFKQELGLSDGEIYGYLKK